MTLFELSKDQVRELREDLAYGRSIPFITSPDEVTDEMLVEMYGDTEFVNEDFTAKPRECANNYFVGRDADGIGEIEICPNCEREISFDRWDIGKDGFKAYCPHCGMETLLCDACHHRFGEFHEEWQPSCSECPFRETGFAEDDVYDWGELNPTKKNKDDVVSKERVEFLLNGVLSWVTDAVGNDEEEYLKVLKNIGFSKKELDYFA